MRAWQCGEEQVCAQCGATQWSEGGRLRTGGRAHLDEAQVGEAPQAEPLLVLPLDVEARVRRQSPLP